MGGAAACCEPATGSGRGGLCRQVRRGIPLGGLVALASERSPRLRPANAAQAAPAEPRWSCLWLGLGERVSKAPLRGLGGARPLNRPCGVHGGVSRSVTAEAEKNNHTSPRVVVEIRVSMCMLLGSLKFGLQGRCLVLCLVGSMLQKHTDLQ